MTVTMFDSVTLSQIPADAPAVAGYVNGKWATFNQIAVQWPNAHRLSISVNVSGDAECLDVEPGDATPDEAPAWVRRQQARGIARPVVYTSISAAQALLNVLGRAGIARDSVRLWTAHYTHSAHLCGPACGYGLTTTADATQWTDRSLGRNLDESLTADSFFGATAPVPPSSPSFPVSEVTIDMSTLHSQFFPAPGVTAEGVGWFPNPLPIPFDKISGSPIIQAGDPTRGELPFAAASVELSNNSGNTVVTYHKLSAGTAPGFTIRWFD